MSDLKPGDIVRLPSVCQNLHDKYPEWYPPPGTEGTVISVSSEFILIKWETDLELGAHSWAYPLNVAEKIE